MNDACAPPLPPLALHPLPTVGERQLASPLQLPPELRGAQTSPVLGAALGPKGDPGLGEACAPLPAGVYRPGTSSLGVRDMWWGPWGQASVFPRAPVPGTPGP